MKAEACELCELLVNDLLEGAAHPARATAVGLLLGRAARVHDHVEVREGPLHGVAQAHDELHPGCHPQPFRSRQQE